MKWSTVRWIGLPGEEMKEKIQLQSMKDDKTVNECGLKECMVKKNQESKLKEPRKKFP